MNYHVIRTFLIRAIQTKVQMIASSLLLAATMACCLRTNIPSRQQNSMHHSYHGVQATPNVALHQAAIVLGQQQNKLSLPLPPQITAFVDNRAPPLSVAVVSTPQKHQSAPIVVNEASTSTLQDEAKQRFSMSSGCESASLPWFNVSAYERWRPPVTASGWIDVYVMPYVRRVDDVVSARMMKELSLSILKHNRVDFCVVFMQNENSEEVKITMQGYMIWRDARLRWSNSVCPVHSILVPSAYLWIPVVEITEVRQFISHLIQDNWVTVHNDGTAILYFSFNALSIRCHLDSSRFPFDTQSCPITFVTFTYENLRDGHSTFAVAEFLDVIAEFGEWSNIEFVPTTPASFHTDTLYAKPNASSSFEKENNSTGDLLDQWNNISLTFTFVQYKLSMTRKALQHVIVWVGPVKILYVIGIVGVFSQDGMSIDAGNLLIVMSLFLMALIDRLPSGFSSFPVLVMNYTVTFLMYGVAILFGNTLANKHRTPGRYMRALATFQHRLVKAGKSWLPCGEDERGLQRGGNDSNKRKKLSRNHCDNNHTPLARPGKLLESRTADCNHLNHQYKPTSLINLPFIDQDRHSLKTPTRDSLQPNTAVDCIKQLHEEDTELQQPRIVPGNLSSSPTSEIGQPLLSSSQKNAVSANKKDFAQKNRNENWSHLRPLHPARCCSRTKANYSANHHEPQYRRCRCCCYSPVLTDADDDIDSDLTISLPTFNNNNLPAAMQHHHPDGDGCCRHQHQHHVAHLPQHQHRQQQHPDQQTKRQLHQQRQKEHEIRSRCACVLCVVFLVTQFVFDLFSVALWMP